MKHTVSMIPGVISKTFGAWELNFHSQDLAVSDYESNTLLELLNKWTKVFPLKPETLCQKEFGVPSVLTRFDYVMIDGKVCVYEIEDRPAFMCIGALVNEQFRQKLTSCFQEIRQHFNAPIYMLVAPSRFKNSDDLLHDSFKIPIFDGVYTDPELVKDGIVFVRSDREESAYYKYEHKSLSTISQEGWKGYGVPMGLWSNITEANVDYTKAFVLKPDFGCRSSNVFLFKPKTKGLNNAGLSTITAIQNAIIQKKVQYIQPYYEPEKVSFLPDNYSLIRRVYFGYSPTGGYQCLGGVYMSRPCLKVHGASDTITGSMYV